MSKMDKYLLSYGFQSSIRNVIMDDDEFQNSVTGSIDDLFTKVVLRELQA